MSKDKIQIVRQELCKICYWKEHKTCPHEKGSVCETCESTARRILAKIG